MKRTLPLLLPLLTAFCVQAQSTQSTTGDSNTSPSPNAGLQQGPASMPPGGPLSTLTREEKTQLKAAHDKAIQQDPSLDEKMKAAHQAMEVARQAMHDAMVKIDPSVEPILAKIAPRKWDHTMEKGSVSSTGSNATSTNSVSGNGPHGEGHPMPPGFANLTPSEQAQLKAAHEQAKNDPGVIAAREAEKNATTPQDRQTAKSATHQAMHDAMLKADPSIEPLLAKLHPQNHAAASTPPVSSPSDGSSNQPAPGQGMMTTP